MATTVTSKKAPVESQTPWSGFPSASVTVAVTVWLVPTVFVAAAGARSSFAGGPAFQTFVAVAVGSSASAIPLPFVSANALITSAPGVDGPA